MPINLWNLPIFGQCAVTIFDLSQPKLFNCLIFHKSGETNFVSNFDHLILFMHGMNKVIFKISFELILLITAGMFRPTPNFLLHNQIYCFIHSALLAIYGLQFVNQ